MSHDEAIERLRAEMTEAVRIRLRSDVPLGAFLSGGMDSAAVLALMAKQSSRPVKTFTIRFQNPEYNEADQAAAVARHVGSEHYEATCGTTEMLEVVARMRPPVARP